MLMRAATVVQQLCKSCRTCFKFYCMFYFTWDRSFSETATMYLEMYILFLDVYLSSMLSVASFVRCDHRATLNWSRNQSPLWLSCVGRENVTNLAQRRDGAIAVRSTVSQLPTDQHALTHNHPTVSQTGQISTESCYAVLTSTRSRNACNVVQWCI